ncbi:MAG: nucleotidyltransferase domain-containing protein [Candidatus Bathyarchaeia archaeon]
MSSELERELNALVDAIKEMAGVVLIVVFGSYARGEFEEGSDVDLLILFENRDVMWENRAEVFRRASESMLFTQLSIYSLHEFLVKCNPIFVRSVLRDGKVLFNARPRLIDELVTRFKNRYPDLLI